MPPHAYKGVPPRLAELIQERAEAEGRSAPRIAGTLPARAAKLSLRNVSAAGTKAMEAAGFRSPAALAGFRTDVLDALVSVPDLDRAHEEMVRQAYAGVKGITTRQVNQFVRLRVMPHEIHWILPPCGKKVVIPGFEIEVDPDILDRLEPKLPDDLFPFPVPEGRKPRPPWDGGRGPDPAPDVLVDLVRDPHEIRFAPDAERLTALLTLSDDELVEHAGELALGAQALALGADADLSIEAVQRLTALSTRRDGDRALMTSLVAPAIGLAAMATKNGAPGGWVAPEAARVLRIAQPGTAVADLAAASWQQAAHAEAQAADRMANSAAGNARPARRRVALDRYARVVAGVDADGNAVSPALTTQGIAALTDVKRALYASLALPGVNGVLADDAPPGLANRAIPPDPTWLVGAGGISSLGSAGTNAGIMRAIGAAHQLTAPPCLPLGGDIFRFDWLLDEVREVADDLAHLDDLLVGLLEHITDAIEQIAALGEEALDRIAAIVEQIRVQADAIATQISRTVGEVIATAVRSATLLGVVHWFSQWPHDQWAGFVSAVGAAIAAGTDPIAAAMAFMDSQLTAGLGASLDPAIASFNAFANDVRNMIGSIGLDPALIQSLADLLTSSGLFSGTPAQARLRAEELLKPITDAGAAATALLTQTIDGGVTSLNALRTTTSFSPEIRGLLLLWFVAPMVALLIAAAGTAIALFAPATLPLFLVAGGTVLAGLISFALGLIVLWGAGMLRALVVRALADLLGIGRDLDAQARAGLRTAFGMLGELQRLLMNAGALKATIDALLGTLSRTVDRLLPDEVAQLRTALLSARDGIRRQLDPMVLALDRAFFRETLIPGASLADLELVAPSAPPPAASGDVRNLRELFGALRLSPQLASLIAQYESKRVSTQPLLGQRQELTHVLSLLDVLGISSATGVVGAPAERLQTLLRDTPLPGGTTLPAAGLAFTLAPALLDRVAPGLHSQLVKDVMVQIDFEPVADEAAFAALAQQLGEAAGGTLDPALASRATGFSLPGLPIAPLRFPTGVPAVLEQSCGSSVRVPPAVVAMYNGCTIGGPCLTPLPAGERPPSLVNVELKDDPNTGAQAAGWRMMTFRDGPVRMMFSHFELTRDSLRFIAEPKQLKPFEHRGVFGAWKLEVPAVVRKFITHDLPKIRDVRLMISTSGQWDGSLRDALSAPPAAATLHTAPTVLPATIDELLETVKSLLDAANLGNLLQLEALLGVPLPAVPGNLVVPTLLPHTQLTNGTAVLGGAVGKWPVTGVRYVDGTAVPANKIVGVRSVRAALTSSAALLTLNPAGVQGVVAFTPTGGQRRQANAELADGVEDLPASALGSPASPIGEWEIDMPAGLPLTALALTIFTEVAP